MLVKKHFNETNEVEKINKPVLFINMTMKFIYNKHEKKQIEI